MEDLFVLVESTPLNTDGEKRTFDLIPDGTIVQAEVIGVQKATKPWKTDAGEPVVKVEWKFKLLDDEYAGRYVWGDTPTTFSTHPDCRMYAWVLEILARDELAPGFKFSEGSLKSSVCRVAIAVSEWNDKVTNESKSRNYVRDVFRSREAELAMAPVAPKPAPILTTEPVEEEPF